MIMRRTRFTCWVTKGSDTHTECIILIALHGNNGYSNTFKFFVVVAYITCLISFGVWHMEDNLIFINGKGPILDVDCCRRHKTVYQLKIQQWSFKPYVL
jgi:hypothetical protein